MSAVLAIRHAPTDWNRERRMQGRADIPLGDAGRAWLAGCALPAGWTGVRCLSSPLSRAMETARLLGLTYELDARLIEMDWGRWEGQTLDALRLAHGAEMAANEARGLDFRPPDGESPRDVQARLASLLSELAAETVIVTHKGVLRALYAMATGWTMLDTPPQRILFDRAHEFEVFADGRVAVQTLNIPLSPG